MIGVKHAWSRFLSRERGLHQELTLLKTYICLGKKRLFIQHVKHIYIYVMWLQLQSMISVIVIKDIVGTYNARICGNTIFWINNMYHRSVHQKLKLKIFKTIVFRPLFLYIRCTLILIIRLKYMCTKIPISCLIDIRIIKKLKLGHKYNDSTTFIYHDRLYLHNYRITNTYFINLIRNIWFMRHARKFLSSSLVCSIHQRFFYLRFFQEF